MSQSIGPLEGLNFLPKRRTLIKERTGCVRSSVYDLPEPDHVYGLKLPPDPESAGEIISNWVTANPSLYKEVGKKIVYSNVLALKHGYITAKQMRQYALDHPNIRMKEPLDEESRNRVTGAHEGPFGVKTIESEDTMEDIIAGKFVSYANDDSDYPDVSCIKKPGAIPLPRSTLSSELMIKARRDPKKEKPRFIMKKFQNVKPTMNLHMTEKGRQDHNNAQMSK